MPLETSGQASEGATIYLRDQSILIILEIQQFANLLRIKSQALEDATIYSPDA